MKKATAMVLAIILASSFLAGCYSKSCCEPQAVPTYKGEG